MRIFLLPISTRRTLLYCEKLPPSATPSLSERLTGKAAAAWASWEQKPSGWQRRVTTYGNSVLRRIPFEEWSLKTLPALSTTTQPLAKPTKILYPSNFLSADRVGPVLKSIATERAALHKQRLIYCVIGMPIVLPVGLIPVLPNFPLMYLLFRAWSHWKALMGGRYLEYLIQKDLVIPEPSDRLDAVYAAGLEHATREKSRAGGAGDGKIQELSRHHQTLGLEREVMLLRGWNGKLLAEESGLPEMEIEIERAVEQVEIAIAAAEAKTADANADATRTREQNRLDHDKKV